MKVSGQLDTPSTLPLHKEPQCLLNRMLDGPEPVGVFLYRPFRSLDNTNRDIASKFCEKYYAFYASYV
jgi:hypothetical protein